MAYDAELADRVRELVAPRGGGDEKRMFGGLAFLLNGNMAVVVSSQGGLMVRVPPEHTERLLAGPHVEPMLMSGRQVRGWIRVTAPGLRTTRQLAKWVQCGVDVAAGLPAK